jgi:hypothetical protein
MWWQDAAFVAFGAALGAVLGWGFSWLGARSERKHGWENQLRVRRAQVFADVQSVLDNYDMESGAVTARDAIDARRRYFVRWRTRIEPIEREIRALSFLETDEDIRSQGFDTAAALGELVADIDLATSEGVTTGDIAELDETIKKVRGEVNALAGLWKDR